MGDYENSIPRWFEFCILTRVTRRGRFRGVSITVLRIGEPTSTVLYFAYSVLDLGGARKFDS